LSKDNEKTLPKDIGSDFSLPGRYEESNTDYFEVNSAKPTPKSRGIWIMAFAFLIVASGFFSYYFINQNEIDSRIIQNTLILDPEKKLVNQYGVEKYGSEHAHAAIAVFVNGEPLNFALSKFQLTSKYIHFENQNPYLLHKHATGVPLEMLFSSMGIKITSDCLMLNYYADKKSGNFCSDQNNMLTFYVNGKPYTSDLSRYVFEHNDRILISYGNEKLIPEQMEYLNSLGILDAPKKIPQYSGDGITI
jgi:hypothetical protein